MTEGGQGGCCNYEGLASMEICEVMEQFGISIEVGVVQIHTCDNRIQTHTCSVP